MWDKIKKFLYSKNDDKIDKKKIIIISLLLLLFLGGVSFGRYAYKEIRDFYLATKKFYFNSDKLTEKGANYRIENWSGVGTYSVTINMNSFDNNNLFSEENINYDIEYDCSEGVTCSSLENKTNGVISTSQHTDSFTIVITVPTDTVFETGEMVVLNIKATSTSPYEKELKGRFTLVVGQYGLSYEIEDSPNSPYLNIRITNTLDYYKVLEAFDSYNVGTQIDIETYQSLPADKKAKCASAIINLSFNPNIIILDMTSEDYQKAISTGQTIINNHNYINRMSFKIDALSSETVKFYKVDTSQNYTYPIVNNNSIITVSYS